MCIIIAKKKGVPYNREELRQSLAVAAVRNEDGAGFVIKRATNKRGKYSFSNGDKKFPIFLSKGYFDTSEDFVNDHSYFLNKIDKENIQDDDELIVHLRYTTSGMTTPTMCHPFCVPPRGQERFLDMVDLFCELPVFAHNGTFYKAMYTREHGSDSYLMAKNYFSDFNALKDLLDFEDDQDNGVFKWFMEHNKLAFITAERDMVLLGEFIEEGSYHYSNSYYKFIDGKSKLLTSQKEAETA